MNNSTTKQKKLLICADSFCAPTRGKHDNTITAPEWAWWSRLAKDLDAEVHNLAISGASNFNIFLQLEYGLKFEPDYILISLTSPQRIEEVLQPIPTYDISYTDFIEERLNSWASWERMERKEITPDVHEKFFDYKVSKRQNELFVESILQRCSDKNSLILANLFHDCNVKEGINFNIIPKEYCDVVTGQLDEPEAGHIHKSYHDKFYKDNKDAILKYYETNSK